MKKIITLLLSVLAMTTSAWGWGMVNNSGTSGVDSFTVLFHAVDSLGRKLTPMLAGDSVFVISYYPGGSVAKRDSMAYNNARIVSTTDGGVVNYSFADAVANFDGTGENGTYGVKLFVKSQTGAKDHTPFIGGFTLYTGNDFNTIFDYIAEVRDSAVGNWEAHWTSILAGVTLAAGAINSTSIDATGANEIAQANWLNATRELTAIDEDNTTMDLNATTIGTVSMVTALATNSISSDALSNLAGLEIAAQVWTYTGGSGRLLTGLGFDLDSTNFAANTFPTWLFTALFFDSAAGPAAGVSEASIWAFMRDSLVNVDEMKMAFWNTPSDTGFTASSVADILLAGVDATWSTAQRDSVLDALTTVHFREKIYFADTLTYNATAGSYGAIWADASYMGGSGGSIDIPTLLDSLFSRVISDYSNTDSAGMMGYYLVLAGDSSLWASYEGLFGYAQAGSILDTSTWGDWLKLNTGQFDPLTDPVIVGSVVNNAFTNLAFAANCFGTEEFSSSLLQVIANRVLGDSAAVPGQMGRVINDIYYYLADSTNTVRTRMVRPWLHRYVDQMFDTLNLVHVEINNIDGWNPATDPVAGIASVTMLVDSVWGRIFDGPWIIAGSMADSFCAPSYMQGALDANTLAMRVWTIPWDTSAALAGSILDALRDSIDAKVSTAGSSANITDADMAAIADTLIKRGFVTYTSGKDSVLRVAAIYAIANDPDTSAFLVANAGGIGVNWKGTGFQAFLAEATSTANAVEFIGAAGVGFRVYSAAADAVNFTSSGGDGLEIAGTNKDINLNGTGDLYGRLWKIGPNALDSLIKKMNDSDFVRYDRDTTLYGPNYLRLNSFIVRGNNDDSSVFIVENISTDDVAPRASGIYVTAKSAATLYASGINSSVLSLVGGGSGTDGLAIYVNANDASGIYSDGQYGLFLIGGTDGLRAVGTLGYGLAMGGSLADLGLVSSLTASGRFDIGYQSMKDLRDTLWQTPEAYALVAGTMAYEAAQTAATSLTAEALGDYVMNRWANFYVTDTVTGTWPAKVLTTALASGCAGQGNSLLIYNLVDTAQAPDRAVPYTEICFRTLSGEDYAYVTTNSAGQVRISATSGDTLLALGMRPGYLFSKWDTVIVTGLIKTDTLLTMPTVSASRSYVYVQTSDLAANIVKAGVRLVILFESDGAVEDTCNGRVVATREAWVRYPDEYGRMGLELICSECLTGGTYSAKVISGIREYDLGEFTVSCEDVSTRLRVNRE